MTRKKARRGTGCTIVRHAGKSQTRSQKGWENGNRDIEGRLEAARRNQVALSEWMLLEEKAT